MKRIYLLLAGVLLLLYYSSCKKIQEMKLMSGDWEMKSVYLNNDTTSDVLDILLPYRSTNKEDCYYQVFFEDDGVAIGNYYTFDTLNYSVTGEWDQLEYNVLYVKLDEYVDGTFNCENMGDGDWQLVSDADSNYVTFFGIGKVHLTMNVTRHKKED